MSRSKSDIKVAAKKTRGGLAQWLASQTTDQGVPGSRPGRSTVCCDLEQVTFPHCLNHTLHQDFNSLL